MKKTLLIAGLIVLALGVLGALSAGVAFAQGQLPPMVQGGYGWMHEYVQQAFAAKLGITEQQVQEQLTAGIPMYQIALDNGIKQEGLGTFMNEVHQEAFAKAVQDGVVTQAQADAMLQRMQNMFQDGTGPGNCPMHNGQGAQFGQGRGMMWGQGPQNP